MMSTGPHPNLHRDRLPQARRAHPLASPVMDPKPAAQGLQRRRGMAAGMQISLTQLTKLQMPSPPPIRWRQPGVQRQPRRGEPWGDCWITPIPNGFQLSCKNPKHQCNSLGQKLACAKTKRSLQLGPAACLRMLKFWAIRGKGSDDREKHMDLWDRVVANMEDGNLPGDEWLEAHRPMNYEPFDESELP